jgi:hypothetical protein
MNLFEINQQIRDILNQVDDDGNLPDSAFEELDKLNMALEIKHEAYGCLIKEYSATSKMLKAEADHLTGRQKAYDSRAARLRQRLADSMLANGKARLETSKVLVWFKSSTGTVIDDESILPQQYLKTKTEPDISAIKESLTAGVMVPGARIEIRQNLQIK